MYYLLTNDVEEHSIQKNRLDDNTARVVLEDGLPKLLNIYAKHQIKTTFYFTGTFIEKFPHAARIVQDAGHEIGCHGYSHELGRALDNLSYEEQLHDITQAKEILQKEVGEIKSFRAPALRINLNTIKIIENLGFQTDSSIASQRFDGPFTFGSKKKIKWLLANRKPYFIDYKNPYRKGKSNILEIPISAFGLAHIGTLMRIFPKIDEALSSILMHESKLTNKPIVFIMHPNECIFEEGNFKIERRTSNLISYIFADILRSNLKIKNLGNKAIELLEEEIIHAKRRGFKFITCDEYRKIYDNIHRNNG
jgi:peptidoglycan/xylan/chitin deacetylase (PgdA/CDA1 family)